MRWFFGTGQVRQSRDHARRSDEFCRITPIGFIAGIGKNPISEFIVIIARLEGRILHILMRNDVRCSDDHEIIRLQRLVDAVNGLLRAANILVAGEGRRAQLLHRGDIVQIDKPCLEAAFFIRSDERRQRRMDLFAAI